MCRHQYEYDGHRSFGGDIPGYAQGAYFPGDEPGTRCQLSGEFCGNLCGDTPELCAANVRTDWLCPECQKSELDSALWKSSESGKYFCRECESEWTEEELPRAFTNLLIDLVQAQTSAIDEAFEARREARELREKIETIRKVAA